MNRLRWMIAGTVLAGGTASAAYLHQQGPTGGPLPDVRPLQALAERIDQMPEPQSKPVSVPTLDSSSSTGQRASSSSHTAGAHATAASSAKNGADEPQTAPLLSPIKSLALIGVTMVGDKEAAWLVDLESHDRFTANEGDDVEGLHVRDIQPDHVILTQNGTDYELRLGEKSAELAAAEPVETASTTPDQKNQNGRGWGGRNWGGRNWGGGRGNSGGGGYSGGGNRFAGNFGGFRRPSFGGFGGGYSGNNSASLGRLTHATSNPQEARRKGVRLVGNVTSSIPQPAAFFNPQTVRRVGSATGHAFGADNSNNRKAINSADPSRSTSAIR